jgi:hypothetical protein
MKLFAQILQNFLQISRNSVVELVYTTGPQLHVTVSRH